MQAKKTPNNQGNPKGGVGGNKNGAEGIRIPKFRLYYKATIFKHKVLTQNRNILPQWKMIKSPEINPHTCGHLICDKGGKIHNEEKTLF